MTTDQNTLSRIRAHVGALRAVLARAYPDVRFELSGDDAEDVRAVCGAFSGVLGTVRAMREQVERVTAVNDDMASRIAVLEVQRDQAGERVDDLERLLAQWGLTSEGEAAPRSGAEA